MTCFSGKVPRSFRRTTTSCAVFSMAVASFAPALAQESGNWRAASTTARQVTGDIAFFNQKISLGFSAFTIAQIRALKPAEVSALFSGADAGEGVGNVYRTSIPGDKRFLHKNTLCGSEETQWVVTFAQGKHLDVAFFSGASLPTLTPEAMANNTELCGTYAYVR